jgi:acetoin utilization deacetylase AcuC-like enzyme
MIMEGTRKCAEFALEDRIALNIAGGTHHAYADRGEGFCLLNDQAIAASWLLRETKIRNILIVDLDVHQGNGTASIFKAEDRVFTFSMHGKNNYPLKKEQSNMDVELEDGIADRTYHYLLQSSLDHILKQFQPDFIFYQCGVDVIESDKLGKLGLTLNGCRKRDRIVFELVRQLNVPVVCSMGGGYSPNIKDIVEAHANTFREAQFILT